MTDAENEFFIEFECELLFDGLEAASALDRDRQSKFCGNEYTPFGADKAGRTVNYSLVIEFGQRNRFVDEFDLTRTANVLLNERCDIDKHRKPPLGSIVRWQYERRALTTLRLGDTLTTIGRPLQW